jgi:hypothetical protein
MVSCRCHVGEGSAHATHNASCFGIMAIRAGTFQSSMCTNARSLQRRNGFFFAHVGRPVRESEKAPGLVCFRTLSRAFG